MHINELFFVILMVKPAQGLIIPDKISFQLILMKLVSRGNLPRQFQVLRLALNTKVNMTKLPWVPSHSG